MTRFRAHDLLELRSLRAYEGEPRWVREALRRAPFVVVRRAEAEPGRVAIGVRGDSRTDRYGTSADDADVVTRWAPEDLVSLAPCRERRDLPVFAALAALREASHLAAHGWGPCGSTGFELASRVPTVTISSDLDLLIRAPHRLPREMAARMLHEICRCTDRAGVRVDAQVETPAGGVALSELVSGKGRVIARSARGPRLVVDPWPDSCALRNRA